MQKENFVQFFRMMVLVLLSVALIIMMAMNTDKILLQKNAFASSSSSSPSFQRQELTLDSGSWFDMFSGKSTRNGANYIDMQSVSYFSNGTYLNATLWLANFTVNPNDYERVDYGMYLDADSNNRTGLSGIDYKVEVSWDNKNRTWTRAFEEWSSSGGSKTLSKEENVTDFFKKDASYVTLSADLDSLLSPNNYRVLFYAEGIDLKKQFSWIIDSTNWISIPDPELVFVVSPSPIELTQGGESIVEVRINSSSAEQLELNINPRVTENNTNTKLITMKLDSEKLVIPPFGVASTHMRVSISPNTQPTDYLIIMRANINTLNTPLFAEPGSTQSETQNSTTNNYQDISISSSQFPRAFFLSEFLSKAIVDQPIFKSSVFSLHVKEWKFDEQLNSFVNQWITPLAAIPTTIASFAGGILGWIYGRRQQKRSAEGQSQNQNHNSNNN
jgi:hypothetical protein